MAAVADVVAVPFWVDAMAISTGAMAGALHAERKRLDVIGVMILAVLVGLGGGIVRDLLLAQGTPVFLTSPSYLAIALSVGGVAFFFAGTLKRVSPLLTIVDAFAIALYAVIGADKALQLGLAALPAIFVGVMSGSAGALLRDVLCGDIPTIMLPGRLNAVATVAGTTAFVLLAQFTSMSGPAAAVVGVAVSAALRFLSAGLGWESPQPIPIDRRLRRWWRGRSSSA
jgi:uncharacterized membrane protein YeiH